MGTESSAVTTMALEAPMARAGRSQRKVATLNIEPQASLDLHVCECMYCRTMDTIWPHTNTASIVANITIQCSVLKIRIKV